jgi:hypothetical protein
MGPKLKYWQDQWEEFEDTERELKISKSKKDRQHIQWPKEKDNRTSNNLQKTTTQIT